MLAGVACAAAGSALLGTATSLARLFASIALRRPLDAGRHGDARSSSSALGLVAALFVGGIALAATAGGRRACLSDRDPRPAQVGVRGHRRRLLVAAVVVVVVARRSEPDGATTPKDGDGARRPVGHGTRVVLPHRSTATRSDQLRADRRRASCAEPAKPTLGSWPASASYFAAGRGLCLRKAGTLAGVAKVRIFDADLKPRRELPLHGLPSRARVSPDGRYGAITVVRHRPLLRRPGQLLDPDDHLRHGERARGRRPRGLRRHEGRQGVRGRRLQLLGRDLRRDDDRFYATLGTGGETYLVRGRPRERTARCCARTSSARRCRPTARASRSRSGSATPSGVAAARARPGHRQETPLAETRPIDDQAEWLDDDHVLYRVGEEIWEVPADGTGQRAALHGRSDSPAVVRAN